MRNQVTLICNEKKIINNFLSKFYNTNMNIENSLIWTKEFQNPIEITEIIGVYIDNIEDFNLSLWLSLDNSVLIKVTEANANHLIKYIYERYPNS